MMMKVRVNCRSINPADAAAPTGSHQVLATKKYVLASVISQINNSNARPIPQSLLNLLGRHERISPRPLPRPTTRTTVGGECTTAVREQCKELLGENPAWNAGARFTRVLCLFFQQKSLAMKIVLAAGSLPHGMGTASSRAADDQEMMSGFSR